MTLHWPKDPARYVVMLLLLSVSILIPVNLVRGFLPQVAPLQAQQPIAPGQPPCTNGIDLSTGTTTPFVADTYGTPDPDWMVDSVPIQNPGSTYPWLHPIPSLPSHPYSVQAVSGWTGTSGNPNPYVGAGQNANWIFPYQGNSSVPDGFGIYWPQGQQAPSYQDFQPGIYNYSIQWTMASQGTLIFYGVTADNGLTLYLDGGLLAAYPSSTNFQTLLSPPSQLLAVGTHKLTAVVQNTSNYTGLLVIAVACPTATTSTTSTCASISGANLLAWWKLDEPAGAPTVADASGNGNNGVPKDANGMTTSISSSVGPPTAGPVPVASPPLSTSAAVPPSALYFYGPYVEAPAGLNFGLSSFAIDGWVWPVQVGSTIVSPIVDKRDVSSALGYALYVEGGKLNLIVNNVLYSSSSSAIPFGTWTHVAATFDVGAGSGAFYINGANAGPISPPYSPSIVSNILPLWIGKSRMTGVGFGEIAIDDLEIWNRTLSQPEIQGIYQAGNAGKCLTTTITTTSCYATLGAITCTATTITTTIPEFNELLSVAALAILTPSLLLRLRRRKNEPGQGHRDPV